MTNNWRDFRPMLGHAGLHAGAIILPNVVREEQVRLFDAALRAAVMLANPPNLVNIVLEIDLDGTVQVYDLPEEASWSGWVQGRPDYVSLPAAA